MSQSEMDAGRIREEGMRSYSELDGSDPRTIERRIDATRADMRATLEAIERRLSFDRLIEMTIGRVRERGGEFAGNLTDAATHNPVPMLLTSIGLGWMMLTSRQGARSSRSAYDATNRTSGVADKMHGAVDSMHGAMDSTRDTLEQSAESVRSTMNRAGAAAREQVDYARERLDSTRERMDRLLDEQPLMLGAIGLAAGAILGALVPTTEHENRWLGDARDRAVRSVAEKSRAGYEAAREHAAVYSAPGSGREDEGGRGEAAQRPH